MQGGEEPAVFRACLPGWGIFGVLRGEATLWRRQGGQEGKQCSMGSGGSGAHLWLDVAVDHVLGVAVGQRPGQLHHVTAQAEEGRQVGIRDVGGRISHRYPIIHMLHGLRKTHRESEYTGTAEVPQRVQVSRCCLLL